MSSIKNYTNMYQEEELRQRFEKATWWYYPITSTSHDIMCIRVPERSRVWDIRKNDYGRQSFFVEVGNPLGPYVSTYIFRSKSFSGDKDINANTFENAGKLRYISGHDNFYYWEIYEGHPAVVKALMNNGIAYMGRSFTGLQASHMV